MAIDSATVTGAVPQTLCWVQVRINWHKPLDSLNAPNDRRVKAMRLTMVSGAALTDDEFSHMALARLNLEGAPWLRRGDRPLSGIAGDSSAFINGYIISSLVGTEDTSSTLHYQPPPGVVEEVGDKSQTKLATSIVQVNEHSLRLQAGVVGGVFPVFNRRRSVPAISGRQQNIHGISHAACLDARTRQRLGHQRRAQRLHKSGARREQFLSLSHDRAVR